MADGSVHEELFDPSQAPAPATRQSHAAPEEVTGSTPRPKKPNP
jgi:hypothetical protein